MKINTDLTHRFRVELLRALNDTLQANALRGQWRGSPSDTYTFHIYRDDEYVGAFYFEPNNLEVTFPEGENPEFVQKIAEIFSLTEE